MGVKVGVGVLVGVGVGVFVGRTGIVAATGTFWPFVSPTQRQAMAETQPRLPLSSTTLYHSPPASWPITVKIVPSYTKRKMG